jgi:thiosulfate/3-mercaptopyruvate sulfurtransferase
MKKLILFLLVAFGIATAQAKLVTVDQLVELMKDPNVVVIDARPSADYLRTHINGAINIDIASLCNATPVEGTLKPAAELCSLLGGHGIARNSKVVVYCKTGINAARLIWILNYLGANDVSMLDGQMDAWFAARKPITRTPKTLSPVTFTAAVNNAINVDKAYVKSKLNTAILVDTRKKEDFVAGKIGSAVNVFSDDLVKDSKLKSPSELAKLFSAVPKDKEVIVYCKTGVSAGLTYFVLKNILSYPNVKVYEGAWEDWNN